MDHQGVFLLCFFFLQPRSSLSDSVTYSPTDHSYSDLLVSINPDLPREDSSAIISNIEAWITQGSQALYQATNGWAYIKSVKILLPSSWKDVPDVQEAVHEVYEDAEIRVESKNPVYGNSPFTLQTGGCGEPGQYIQTSGQFFTQFNLSEAVFGPPGQVFVHEWAKLRYGVFEEYGYPGDPLYPMFYYRQVWSASGQTNRLQPNFCTNVEPVGYEEDQSVGGPCTYETKTGLPDENCVFIATETAGLTSSIMAIPYLSGNEKFCDETEDHIHRPDIPTKHNVKCDGQSVFSVVKQHQDFTDYTPNLTEQDTTPQFTLLRPAGSQAFVMVLDFSGSMKLFNRVGRLKQAVKRFMQYDIQNGVPVGIVRFSSEDSSKTYIVEEIAPVTDEIRNDIINKTEALTAVGGTCLGDGLLKGLEAFTNYNMTKGGVMIFLTDGEFSCDNNPNIGDVINDITAHSVRVVTIAFGTSADKNIEDLADKTGGQAYFVPDESGPADINNALTGSLAYQPSVSTADTEIRILLKTFTNKNSITETVVIDKFSGRDVVIQIDFNSTDDTTIEMDFSGETLLYNFAEQIGVFTQTIPLVNPGEYSINITSNGDINFMTLMVKSKAPNDSLPLTTKCWTSIGEQDLNLTGPEPGRLAVMAQVMQGYSPVIGADVRAFVESDSAGVVELVLRDEGMEPDGIKDDGIYSQYFTEFLPNVNETRYTLNCQVLGNEYSLVNQGSPDSSTKSRSLPSTPSPQTPSCCGSTAVKEDSILVSTGNFRRSKSGGMISVGSTKDLGANIYPPGKISDLRLGNMIFSQGVFELSFTSPGEDLDKGIISSYQIFFSTNRTMLAGDLGPDLSQISSEHLACDCNLAPVPAMVVVVLTLNMTMFGEEQQFYFTVLTTDQEGKEGKHSQSNIAGIYLTNTAVPALEDLGLTWGIAVGIVIGSMFGTFLVAGAVMWHKNYYNW